MTVKQVTKYKTDDGSLFDSNEKALLHEKTCAIVAEFENEWFHGICETPSDFIDFINAHRSDILILLGIQEL